MTSVSPAPVRGPYQKGIRRREEIIRSAAEVFGELGYAGGSLRTIAERVGTTSATLIQHFGSKDGLLAAVLEDWTEQTLHSIEQGHDGLAYFAAMHRLMHFHLGNRGLLELFITMAAEASSPKHPAADFIRQRYRDNRHDWGGQLRIAVAKGEVNPLTEQEIDDEIVALTAMADGLELRWLIDPAIDLPRLFSAYLDQAVSRWTAGLSAA